MAKRVLQRDRTATSCPKLLPENFTNTELTTIYSQSSSASLKMLIFFCFPPILVACQAFYNLKVEIKKFSSVTYMLSSPLRFDSQKGFGWRELTLSPLFFLSLRSTGCKISWWEPLT